MWSASRTRPLRTSAVLLAGTLTLASAVQAQGVTGIVRDASTSAPLPGVLVSVMDAGDERIGAVLTDAAGRFAVEAAPGDGYRVRAERIGLRTAWVEGISVDAGALRFVEVAMLERALEIGGLVVDTRVKECSVDRGEAVRLQYWWNEIRKALDVSAVVQSEGLARFRIQRYQRELSADLRSVSGEQTELQIGYASRPFVSMPARFLADGGFVQGEEGSREYFAPDADVLLSDVFLSQHCFSLVQDDDREDEIGVRFEPSRSRKIPDILGTLWVDTLTSELRTLEYRYANLDWIPPSEAGGEVSFRYLPSGTWIVSDWFIRMPRVGVRYGTGPVGRAEVAGYMDVGGRVRQLSTTLRERDAVTGSSRIRGIVFDSLGSRPLAGARVAVLGTTFTADADAQGRFEIDGLPSGPHEVSFFHNDLSRLGISSPFVEVELDDDGVEVVELAVPRFRTVAMGMCGGAADVETVLTGHVVDDEGRGVEGTGVELRYEVPMGLEGQRIFNASMSTGSGGRFRYCGIPAEASVTLTVEGSRTGSAPFVIPGGTVTYRELAVSR